VIGWKLRERMAMMLHDACNSAIGDDALELDLQLLDLFLLGQHALAPFLHREPVPDSFGVGLEAGRRVRASWRRISTPRQSQL